VEFISESTAAALSYGLLVAGSKTVAIFDFGGGTTDVSILKITEGESGVLATAGNACCGGRNIDTLLLQRLLLTVVKSSATDNPVSSGNLVVLTSIELSNEHAEYESQLRESNPTLHSLLLLKCTQTKVQPQCYLFVV
jgi:molecular chaperone DnaK (HSP70)